MLTNIACPPPSPLNPSQSSPLRQTPKMERMRKGSTIIIIYHYYKILSLSILLLSTIIIIIRPTTKCHRFMKIINRSEQIFWIWSIWLKHDGSSFFQVQWCLSLCFTCTRFLQACPKVVWTFAPPRQMLLVKYTLTKQTNIFRFMPPKAQVLVFNVIRSASFFRQCFLNCTFLF